MNTVTVIINPRDRYSGLMECIERLYECTPQPFTLWVLDLGYPSAVLGPVRERLADQPDARIIELGLGVPMDALRAVRADIETPRVVLLDNDTRVSAGWLPPLLAAVDGGAAVVSPLVLESNGLDQGAELRNHLYTGQLRVVDVADQACLIEQKHYRRTPMAEIPGERAPTGTFEMHCVMFDTATFQAIELPSMVTREHLDISLQVHLRGQHMLVEPASVVTFDNLATRMNLADMRFFFHRWSRRFTQRSAELFERRWGYRFYSEQAMYNWVVRRKTFLLCRWFGLPTGPANFVTRAVTHFFCRDWDPLVDPEGASRPLLDEPGLAQRSHAIS